MGGSRQTVGDFISHAGYDFAIAGPKIGVFQARNRRKLRRPEASAFKSSGYKRLAFLFRNAAKRGISHTAANSSIAPLSFCQSLVGRARQL